MALSEGEKKILWGLGFLAVFGAGLSALGADDDDDHEAFDDEVEGLRPGRALELSSLGTMDWKYGEENVLDNPTVRNADGTWMRPDVVVTDDDDDIVEVREAKDVAELTEFHVLQAARYDQALGPRKGTTIDVAEDTYVPREVRLFASALDIAINRLKKA